MKLQHLFKRLIGLNGCRTIAKPRRARPRLELLEDRTVPTQTAWTNASGDWLWATASNWTAGAAPGAGDYVSFDPVFSSDPSVVDAVYSVDRVNFNAGSGVLWIPTGSTISTGLGNYFDHQGTLVIGAVGGATITTSGDYYLTNGEIDVLTGATLTISAGNAFEDSGTIHVGAGGLLNIESSVFNLLPFKTIIVDAGGVLLIEASSLINIDGDIINAGLVSLTSPIIKITGDLVGAGAVAVNVPTEVPPGSIALDINTFINERGRVIAGDVPSVAAAVALIAAGGNVPGGSPAGGEGVTPGFTLVGGNIRAESTSEITLDDGAHLDVTGGFTLEGSLTLTYSTGTITGPLHMDGGDVGMSGDGTILTVNGSIDAQSGANLSVEASSLIVTGNLDMSDPSPIGNEFAATNSTITVGGTFTTDVITAIHNELPMASGDMPSISVGIDFTQNGGTVEVHEAYLTVGGTYYVNGGTSTLDAEHDTRSYELGALQIAAGATLNLRTGVNLVVGGGVQVYGTLWSGNGLNVIDGDVSNQGTVILEEGHLLAVYGDYDQHNGVLEVSLRMNGGSGAPLEVQGTASISGASTLRVLAPMFAETPTFQDILSASASFGDFAYVELPPPPPGYSGWAYGWELGVWKVWAIP